MTMNPTPRGLSTGPVRALVRASAGPLLVSVCLAATPASAIVGPSVDGSGLAASVVMVLNRVGGTAGFCSGIVVGRRAVLTAAHCVPRGADLRIHFRDEAGAPVLLRVDEVERHPAYREDAIRTRQRSIDLALLRLPDDLPGRFRAAVLGSSASAPVGTTFRIAGFGVEREGEGASSGQLRAGTLAAGTPLSSVLLWARDPASRGTGACTGDSGGPVLDQEADRVEAVTLFSAGEGRRRCGALTQALWIGPHRDWIDGILRGWGLAR